MADDWNTVTVIGNKHRGGGSSKSSSAINNARRRGENVTTEEKYGAAQNKHSVTTMNTAKLDRETEELRHDKVPLGVGKLIQQGRQDKGLTQKDLATKICEKPQVVNEYESGKAVPNQVKQKS
jgi:putative transcription factor